MPSQQQDCFRETIEWHIPLFFVKQIVDAEQDDNFTVILHNYGNDGHCTQEMVSGGARALHFGNVIDMVEVLDECPSEVVIMGNLNPVGVFKQGSVESVKQKSENCSIKQSGTRTLLFQVVAIYRRIFLKKIFRHFSRQLQYIIYNENIFISFHY